VYTTVLLSEDRSLVAPAQGVTGRAWPEFMKQDQLTIAHWRLFYDEFLDYQYVLIDPHSDAIAAVANCAPLDWDGGISELPDGGIDWFLTALAEFAGKPDRVPRTLFAYQIVVAPDFMGRAISTEAVKAMVDIGRRRGCRALYAPVRPSLKHRYPLIPIERYIRWTDGRGLPFDPWMRVHARLGADIVRVCPKSMRMEGTVADWERWTNMRFPETGEYVVPDALVPVKIDREADAGVYIEPNVWMRHWIEAK